MCKIGHFLTKKHSSVCNSHSLLHRFVVVKFYTDSKKKLIAMWWRSRIFDLDLKFYVILLGMDANYCKICNIRIYALLCLHVQNFSTSVSYFDILDYRLYFIDYVTMYDFKKTTLPICLKFWDNDGIDEIDAHTKFQAGSSSKT